MTAHKAFTLICDYSIFIGDQDRCERSITIGYETGPVNSVTDVRNWAAEQGWTYTRRQDRCPKHKS